MDTNEKRRFLFEQMPVKRAVLLQILPAIASQLITLIYNLADTYFVGLLNSPAHTAAVTVSAPAFLLLTTVTNLFGVGGGGAIARALGKKNLDDASRLSSVSVYGGLVVSLLFSLVFLVFMDPILMLCGAATDTLALARGYTMWVVVLGGPFTVLSQVLANLVRAEGGAKHASFGISLGGLCNIVLDPLFVLPQFLGLGAVGAGAATALSAVISAVYFAFYLVKKRRQSVLSVHPRLLKRSGACLKRITKIGFPSALQIGLTVVSLAALSRFVAGYDTEAVAALGIVKKLDQLPLFFAIGVSNGLLPLVAYNHAAGNETRRKKAFWFGASIAVSFALLCVLAYELFAPQLASIFIQDTKIITYSASFLRRMVIAMPMMALCYPMIIQFQAMGCVKESLICSILRKGALDIPLLFLFDALWPLYGIMWVQPAVDAISLVIELLFYRQIGRRKQEALLQ